MNARNCLNNIHQVVLTIAALFGSTGAFASEDVCHVPEFWKSIGIQVSPESVGAIASVSEQMGDEARCNVSFQSLSCARPFFDRFQTYSRIRSASQDSIQTMDRLQQTVEGTLRARWSYTIKQGGFLSGPRFSNIETNTTNEIGDALQNLSNVCMVGALGDDAFLSEMEEFEKSATRANSEFTAEQQSQFDVRLKGICKDALLANEDYERAKADPSAPMTAPGYGNFASEALILDVDKFVSHCDRVGVKLP